MVRTIRLACVLALGAGLLASSPAAAGDEERPLTREEIRAAASRVRAAELYLQQADAALASTASTCPQPTGGGTGAGTSEGTSGPTTQACAVPAAFLAVEARDQIFSHYCGPAVGQVISNYSWMMGPGANKFTQQRIAGWMRTDINGRTDAPFLEDGLETATINSPRRPANWDWVVLDVRDRNGNGSTGDELHGYLRANISNSRMPLAIPVKPHDAKSNFHLVSWPRAVVSVGHWIAAYGWWGTWDGTDFARTYYTDSSRDEGGSTGKFWDPTRHIAILINEHTKRIVW